MQYDKLTYSDIDKISHLQPEGWPEITHAFQFYCNHDFCNPVKMTIDNEIVGIGNSILFDKTAWLAHIIVNSDHRNRGIGYKIVDSLIEDIKTRGIETSLLIATELGEPVYIKAGFHKISDYRYFKRESPHSEKNSLIIFNHIKMIFIMTLFSLILIFQARIEKGFLKIT
jgi:GNAT superfamily N-acetyltransferase